MEIEVVAYPGETGVVAVLTARPGATGTPAANYALTGAGSLYTGTIAQSLTGEWLVQVTNGDSEPLYAGFWTAGSDPRCYDYTKPSTSTGGGGGGGTTFDQAPVTPTGRLRQIIIGDDYLEANSRAFIWTVPAVTGFVAGAVTVNFGASAVFACGAYSFLVSRVGVTDNGDGTWEVSIDLPGSATVGLEPGDYDWSMTLSYNGVNITKIQNLSLPERVKIFSSPS